MNTNTELDKRSAQVEAPGSWWCVVSDCSQQYKQHVGEGRNTDLSPHRSHVRVWLVLEELSASQFLHLEALWEAGVPLRTFKRKIRNFLNGADTKDRGTWCTCDKIQQLDKGVEDHSGAEMVYLGMKCGSSTSQCNSRTYHRLTCGLVAKPCADTSSG